MRPRSSAVRCSRATATVLRTTVVRWPSLCVGHAWNAATVAAEGVPDGLIEVTAGFPSVSVLSAAVVSRAIADAIVDRAAG